MRLIVNGILLLSLALGGFGAKLAYQTAYQPSDPQVSQSPSGDGSDSAEADPEPDPTKKPRDTVVRFKRCQPPAVRRGKKCVVFVKPKKQKQG